jgi:hypothetical protein
MTPPQFCDYLPFEEELVLYLNNSGSHLPKDDLYQEGLKLAYLFWRRRFFFNINTCKYGFPYCSPSQPLWTIIWTLLIDWLIDYLRFYVPLKNFSLIWRRHHCPWRAAKFRPMLGAQGLWAGRDLYRATSAVTRDLGFFGLIRRTASFSRLLRHTRGCGESILTRILTGIVPDLT